MSRVDLFKSATITVEDTNQSYNTYDDWNLYITNTDCIGEPKQYTKYIEVPGRSGLLDLSETVAGRQIYTSREIKMVLAGPRDKTTWNAAISILRNRINGKICHVIFDDDPLYYWRGRIDIKDFSSVLNLGTLTIDLPTADPYKYSVISSAEPWLWDPFNFETDMITYIGAVTISGSGSLTIPNGHMPTTPDIVVSDKTSTNFTVAYSGITYALTVGSNKIPAIMVGGKEDVTLDFTGSAKVQIVYRGGSL